MEKLKCLIVDDEPLAHRVILEYASEIPYIEVVGQAHRATEALSLLKTLPIDVIFLDIQMPKLNGLEMLRLVDNPPEVIVTSAYESYALQGYELSVCDYLLKPFRLERFIQATDKALRNVQQRHGVCEDDQVLFIKSDKRIVQVAKADIFYFESYGNYVKIWTTDQYLLTPRTLTSFQDELPHNRFVRIHNSYIINMQQLQFVEGNRVVMKNGKELPVSKRFRQVLLDLVKGH